MGRINFSSLQKGNIFIHLLFWWVIPLPSRISRVGLGASQKYISARLLLNLQVLRKLSRSSSSVWEREDGHQLAPEFKAMARTLALEMGSFFKENSQVLYVPFSRSFSAGNLATSAWEEKISLGPWRWLTGGQACLWCRSGMETCFANPPGRSQPLRLRQGRDSARCPERQKLGCL